MPAGMVALVSDSAGFGGAERYLTTLVSELRDEWRFVAVLGDLAGEETNRRLADAGAETVTVSGLRRRPRLKAIAGTARILRKLEPDLVHVNLTDQGDGLGPLVAARMARRPTIATLHLVIPGRRRRHEWISARALRLPRAVIGVSGFVTAYASGAGADAIAVPNGLEVEEFAPAPRGDLGLERRGIVVGGIGRLHEQKGWDVLCAAAPLVHRTHPEAELVVIGDGPERERLERLGAENGVRFLGYRENASALIRAFDVVVMPSRYEAFGLVAIEAMLAGVPVVATAVGGLPEVVGDCGRLVAPERPDLLANAIVALIEDRAERAHYAERAEKRARSRFSPARMAADMSIVYRSKSHPEALAGRTSAQPSIAGESRRQTRTGSR